MCVYRWLLLVLEDLSFQIKFPCTRPSGAAYHEWIPPWRMNHVMLLNMENQIHVQDLVQQKII